MSQKLSVQIEKQCCSRWCWAAVLSMSSQLLPNDNLPQTQPDWVEGVYGPGLGCSCCCPNSCPDLDVTCNLYAAMGLVMSRFGLSYNDIQSLASVGFDGICSQIDRDRPVIAQIDYDPPSVGAHYLLIYGYETPDTLVIGDPASGESMAVQFSSYSASGAYSSPGDGSEHGSWNSVFLIDSM